MRAPLFTLDRAEVGSGGVIRLVAAPADAPEWAQRLAEIGFLPGERVRVTARGPAGGDPLAVRVGPSTFALRRSEAACVHLAADDREP